MRIILKIFLFPITLLLTIIVAVCRFVCAFSSALLVGLSLAIFTIAVLALVLLKDPSAALTAAVVAFIISPYGVPKFAEWLTDRIDGLNCAMKSI